MTVESVEGGRIVGTFRGTVPTPDPSNTGAPPVTVEGGTFALAVTELGV